MAKPRRGIANMESHPGKFALHAGFIVTGVDRPHENAAPCAATFRNRHPSLTTWRGGMARARRWQQYLLNRPFTRWMSDSGRRVSAPTEPTFLIWAPHFSHRSAGSRALYRLCHHLNEAGFPSAIVTQPGNANSGWNTPEHTGGVGEAIVIYPEIVSGNPFGAKRVVRWALNTPGLLAGDTVYATSEEVFVYDPQKLDVASRAIGRQLGPERVMWVSVIDPAYIYPDPSVPKTIDITFTNKGRALAERFPPPTLGTLRLEDLTPDHKALGETLRRTRTVYSYDHYSNLLREAHISGCDIRVVDDTGRWHDPRGCDCALNIVWEPGIEKLYAAQFHDNGFVANFVRELRKRWDVAGPIDEAAA